VRGVVTGVTSVPGGSAEQAMIGMAPHPAGDLVRITLPDNLAWNSLEIMDIHGRALVRRTLDEDQALVSIDLADVAPGAYILSVHHATGVVSRPLVRY